MTEAAFDTLEYQMRVDEEREHRRSQRRIRNAERRHRRNRESREAQQNEIDRRVFDAVNARVWFAHLPMKRVYFGAMVLSGVHWPCIEDAEPADAYERFILAVGYLMGHALHVEEISPSDAAGVELLQIIYDRFRLFMRDHNIHKAVANFERTLHAAAGLLRLCPPEFWTDDLYTLKEMYSANDEIHDPIRRTTGRGVWEDIELF